MAVTANTIKIKRSTGTSAPGSLKSGELAYSYGAGTSSNHGGRLFFGSGDNGSGIATEVVAIGGKYFADMLDQTPGTLTASSAIIVDSDGKIDYLKTTKIQIGGATYPYRIFTQPDDNLELVAGGTANVQINGGINSFKLPNARTTTTGYVLTANTDGTTSWAAAASDLSLKAGTHTGDTGSDATINLLTDDLEIRGDAGAITTALSKTTAGINDHFVLEVAARLASTSQTGVASFASATFEVSITGEVTVKAGGISNTQLDNSSIYIGDTSISLGNASNDVTSLNIDITGNADTVTNGVYTTDTGTVTNTMLENSTISGVSLGDDLADLTLGTNLSFASGSTYNGGTAREIDLASALTGITSISASSGNTVTLNNGTDNLVFDAAGQLVLPKFTFPNASGTAGQVLVWQGTGASSILSWQDVSTSLTIQGDTGGSKTVSLLHDNLVIQGKSGSVISTAITRTGTSSAYTYTLDIDANLSSYVTSSSLSTTLMDYVTSSSLSTTLSSYVTSSSLSTTLMDYVTSSSLSTTLSSYVTSSSLSTTLMDYVTSSSLSTTLMDYVTSSSLSTTLMDYVTSSSLSTTLMDYVTSSSLSTTLMDYAQSSDTFYIGTTEIALNQASNTITSLAVDISGTATYVTNGVYTTDTATVTNTMLANSTISGISLGSNLDDLTVGSNLSLDSGTTYNGGSAKTISLVNDIEITSAIIGNLSLHDSVIENSSSTGSVDIVVNDGVHGDKTWTFETTGNLEAPIGGRITGLADPESAQDAATRHYVDSVAQGLNIHAAVLVATTMPLSVLTGDTATYTNGTNGVGAQITLSTAITTIDGIGFGVGYIENGSRILVKNEGDVDGLGLFANGIYTINGAGTILTRADDFNTAALVDGGDFTFVQFGSTQKTTGWVQTESVVIFGTDSIIWEQFSGAGTYQDGDGLLLTGNVFSVRVNDTTGGIELYNDKVQLKSSLAGEALNYTDGVLDVRYDDTSIELIDNNLQIKSTWAGQSAITTLGTITTGTWHADTITYNYGGTGFSTYAKGDMLYASAANTLSKLEAGTNGQTLQLQDGVPVWADLDGGTY